MRNWYQMLCGDAASSLSGAEPVSAAMISMRSKRRYGGWCQMLRDTASSLAGMQPVSTVMTSPPYFGKRCYGGDMTNELGKELDDTEYIVNLVRVFNAVPLHPDGSVWVNIGDTRASNGSMRMVPERFAWVMQKHGWHLADVVIWAKVEASDDGSVAGHCMVEPAVKRLNGNGHEYLYRFTRCLPSKAWVDAWSVMVPRLKVKAVRYLPKELMSVESSTNGRCLSNVWRVQLARSLHKHYAPYPLALCERPIAMTCPMNICAKCGFIRTRLVEKQCYDEPSKGRNSRIFGRYTSDTPDNLVETTTRRDAGRHYVARMPVTTGWSECDCKDWERGIVLDPFVGSGTTGEVALKMGRSFIGIDLYSKHSSMAEKRCEATLAWLQSKNLDAGLLEQ